MQITQGRDHGGNLDAAISRFGGTRETWIDLSTGINPTPYPLPDTPEAAWRALPDQAAVSALETAARDFWGVPNGAAVLAVPGASSAIAHIPLLAEPGRVLIPAPTYNEHAASFRQAGWQIDQDPAACTASVHVHPNNPDGRLWNVSDMIGQLRVIDESFCDVAPSASHVTETSQPGTLVLKSFGKFWGLAGLRLGFVIGDPRLLARIKDMLGPWPVAGPALHIGQIALRDTAWAAQTRSRLAADAQRLDDLMTNAGARAVGGTTLFRLYEVPNALDWQVRLGEHHLWSRFFPYNAQWLRLGLPAYDQWDRLRKAVE